MMKSVNLYLVSIIIAILYSSSQYYFCSAQNSSSGTNPCETSGTCGAYGVCDPVGSPTCSCLPGFNPVSDQEWTSGNWTRGCRRRVPLACDNATTTTTSSSSNNGTGGDGFLSLPGMRISGYTDQWSGPERECNNMCLNNCSCLAYGFSFDVRDSPTYLGSGCVFWHGNTLLHLQRNESGSNLNIRVPRSELDTISSDLSLRDPNTISSFHQVFQLGFFSPPNNTNRYLGVFYTVSPEIIIWVANRDRPLNDSSGSLTLAPDGNLVLSNRWNETVWSTNATISSLSNTSAQLQDTGNLILRDNSTGNIIWESFWQPSDVDVPTMRLSYDTNTHAKVHLSSWRSPSDPAVGNFTSGIEALTIPQCVTRQNGRPYWRSGPWKGGMYNGIQLMDFSQGLRGNGGPTSDQYGLPIPQMYEQNGTFNYVLPEGSFLTKTVLNSTGHLIDSWWNDHLKDWSVVWGGPIYECEIYGTCGPFGSCSRFDSPICSCLTGFEPANPQEWNRGNWTGGCVRRRKLQCSLNNNTRGTEDRFLRLPFMKVPDFGAQVPSIQPDECMIRCLGNCSCTAYAHDPYNGCMLWHDSLIDVMARSDLGIDLNIRLSASEFDKPENRWLVIVIPAAAGGCAVISIIILIAWYWMFKRKVKNGKARKVYEAGQALPSDLIAIALKDENIEELQFFTLETLANATGQFSESNLLGKGGFGPVYKGILANGKEIAVKRLSVASEQGNKEFMNEVVVISKLQHRNLVKLVGCCVEREEKMLIYEYMYNQSLDRCLYDPTHESHKILDWRKRFSIIEGIGRGLMYLHSDSRLKIIHRDLKPSNVLLDYKWNPKISDFGMARIFGSEEEHGNTERATGTYGYMAPEYAMEGQYSEKSDIYSFGVLILEIMSGKKNTHYYNEELSSSLLPYAWKMWHSNHGLAFVDQTIAISSARGEIERCVNIALLCVQEFPNDRPSIETVLSMLSNEIIDLPVPQEPLFPEKWNAFFAGTAHTLSQQHGHFVNELTISVMDGR